MDKSRDVSRVLSRYSAHNRFSSKKKLVISELSGGATVFPLKSRREKRRRLRSVERSGGGGGCEATEMGSGKSDSQDDELPSSTVSAKKLKPHKKIDRNGVDRDSVPRKLRTVIQKRTCHPISGSLLNPKNHVNDLQTTKKFNPEQMSKDEEEVAEALYALAGMVPSKVTSLEDKSDSGSPSKRQMHSKKLDDSLLSSQGPQALDEAAEETCNQTSEELSNQKMEVGDLGKFTPVSQPKLSQTILNLNASLQVNHQSLTKPISETKHEHVLIGSKINGSTLLPRLKSQASHASGADDGFPSQYSATKLPYWLHTVASSSEPGLHHSQVSKKIVVCEIENRSRWIKSRCATHVYISKFIQLSQKLQGMESSPVVTHQLKPSEGVTLGALIPVSNETPAKVPDSRVCSSSLRKNIKDASNDTIITLGRCSHGQEQSSLATGNSILTKRSYDFLSLSTGAGGSGKEHKIDAQRNKIQSDPLAGMPVPQLQPLTRYDSVASLPLTPNYIQLNAYQNLHSASAKPPLSQVHLQLPPYFTRSNQMDSNATSVTKQPQLQPQLAQQHPVWMTQPATQYTQAQIAHWQNSRQEAQILQYTHAQIRPSHSSLSPGAHFPKYFQMPQQNHQMLHISAPFPSNQANSQHNTVPIWCEKSGS